MTNITVKSLADEINVSVDCLIEHCSNAGLFKTHSDYITEQEKDILLTYLRSKKDLNSKAFILRRKVRSTLNISGINGKNKSVLVEVRKKRTYLKCDKENLVDTEKLKKIFEKKLKNNNLTLKKETFYRKKSFEENKITKKQYVKVVNKKNSNNVNNQILDLNKSEKSKEFKETKRKIDHKKPILETRKTIKTKFLKGAPNKDNKKYRFIKPHHTKNIKEDTNKEIENIRRKRIRNIKNVKLKKSIKNFEIKENQKKNQSFFRIKIEKKQRKKRGVLLQQIFQKPEKIVNRDITVGKTISVLELANKMAIKSSEVIKKMMKLGLIATINQALDQETAQLVAEEMGHKVTLYYENELEQSVMKDRDLYNKLKTSRAPVVTIMGHVDHGKTSLLDYIRSTKTVFKESGGITQHIGAYHVRIKNKFITFLDTPGHAAFTSMRARGVQVTDIVVLVVAADDGVMPQTIEAIQHAKAANVPILVAINKIDKLEADNKKVKNELMKYNICPEEWGGENIFVNVSAKSGKGIDDLLGSILLQAEMLELKAITNCMAKGVIIESSLDKGCGPIATVLIREGTLRKGDIVLCGCEYGKIRAIKNELRYEINSAKPSIPVEILGLSGVPMVGDEMTVVRNEKMAKEVSYYRKNKFRETKFSKQKRLNLENIFTDITKKNNLELNIVLKSDVQGSLEAIFDSLTSLSNNSVQLKIIGSGVGSVTETDVSLAMASNAIIIGFNIQANTTAKRLIQSENLDFRCYSVIYKLIDEIKSAMKGMLSTEYKQEITGLVEVRNVFKSPKFGVIAGCMVIEGSIKRNSPIRILRKNIVVYKGELQSLRRFKDDVNEVKNGFECGISIKNYNEIYAADIIEVFKIIKI